MTLQDAEQALAAFLEGAGLGLSTSSTPLTLYLGEVPLKTPDRLVCVRQVGGEASLYLGTGGGLVQPELQVVVRGEREGTEAARQLAAGCWTALHLAEVPGCVSVRCEGAGPLRQPPDGSGRPRFSFNVLVAYSG